MEGRKPGRGSRAGCTPGWLHEAQALHLPSLAWTPFHLSSFAQGSPHPHGLCPWSHGPGFWSRQVL